MTIRLALAGAGAFGIEHLDGLRRIDVVEVVSLVGRDLDKTKTVADQYGIAHVSIDLADSLAIGGLDAVILCTPTQLHAAQARTSTGHRVMAVERPYTDVPVPASNTAVGRFLLTEPK